MFSGLESGLGLDVVVWLQAHGSDFLDVLANILDFLGSDIAFLILLPLIYWSVNRRLGRRLFMVLLFGLVAVLFCKILFAAPRPYQAMPELVRTIVDEEGFGLPSGHVTLSLLLWGYLIYWFKRPRWWWVLGPFAVLMALGRMYGGVHYPQDVIAGALLGLSILWLSIHYGEVVIGLWRRFQPQAKIALVLLCGLVAFVFLFYNDIGQLVTGFILGGGWGVILEEQFIKFSAGGSWRQRSLRFVCGVVLLIGLFFGLRVLFAEHEPQFLLRTLRYGLTALFMVAGWPWLSLRLGLTQHFIATDPTSSVTPFDK